MNYKTNISILGKSNKGCVRTNNEDAWVAQNIWDDNTYLAVAIDGVGGYEGGEIAAAIAQKTIPEFLLASSNGERVELLKQAVTAANNAIFEARETDPEHGQMSCVLTAAIIDVAQRQISMAHVGDSRLYSFHHGELKKLSHDHSLIGYREEIGDLSEEEAMHHPQRNVIGRDVGSQRHKANDDDFIEAQVFSLLPNTTLLFCSDGLTDMITKASITNILGERGNVEEKIDALINAALEAGGKDNVTVVLFEYQSDEPDIASDENETKKESVSSSSMTDNPNDKDKHTINQPTRKKWPIVVSCFFIGLLVGTIVAFFGMNSIKNKFKGELEEQQKRYTDSIFLLQNEIEGFKAQYQPQDSIVGNNTDLQTQIESLQRQNDSLRMKLKDTEDQNKQLENEIKLFVKEIDALRKTL